VDSSDENRREQDDTVSSSISDYSPRDWSTESNNSYHDDREFDYYQYSPVSDWKDIEAPASLSPASRAPIPMPRPTIIDLSADSDSSEVSSDDYVPIGKLSRIGE